MSSCVKIFLLWLLALAIPVQGFAAAVQTGCASGYQTHAMAERHHMGKNLNGMHDMHDTHAMQADAQLLAATDAHPSSPQQHQQKTSSASCSSCSVCTIGAILPLALDKLINLPGTADVHVALVQHGFVGYLPENPERPPSLTV